ncbi:MAG: AraC family transcriptional regulator, partial [Candidatus Omnitrophica bacterium]|nr:AraC family transcriptional regulator [Candidatus Omnitrophota bacterium]
FVAIHFLPSVVFDLVSANEATSILYRFAARSELVNPGENLPRDLRSYFRLQFKQLKSEFDLRRFGWEAKLRIGLGEMLINFTRWELDQGLHKPSAESVQDWTPLERALRYLRTHIAEPIYARDLAKAAGLSESRLKVLFHDVLGASWSHYLQALRIRLAAARLSEPGQRVTDVAMDLGFENLSHFDVTFRSFMGISPREYVKQRRSGETGPAQKSE